MNVCANYHYFVGTILNLIKGANSVTVNGGKQVFPQENLK